MSRWLVRTLTLSTLVTGVTGLLLYVMTDWMTPDDPFAVVNHPLQPLLLKLHLLAAPVLIFALGVAAPGHILPRWRSRRREGRRTGVLSAWLFPVMVISGVLLQVLTGTGVLAAARWTHLISGLLFAGGYLAHRLALPLPAGDRGVSRSGDPFPAGGRRLRT